MLDTRLDHVALLFSGLAILMWGCWGFFGKLGLERGMSPRSILFAELLVGGLGAALVLTASLVRHHSAAPVFQGWNIFGVFSGFGRAARRRSAPSTSKGAASSSTRWATFATATRWPYGSSRTARRTSP